METKNLVIFFPWGKQDIARFRQLREKTVNKSIKDSILTTISNSCVMTNAVLSTMNFEDHLEIGTFVSDYLDDEDWRVLENRNTILGETEPRNPNWKTSTMLQMHCMRTDACRGWVLDLKKLVFYRLSEYSLEFCKGKMKTMKSFDDLEKFKEDFNFRFASKKFGL